MLVCKIYFLPMKCNYVYTLPMHYLVPTLEMTVKKLVRKQLGNRCGEIYFCRFIKKNPTRCSNVSKFHYSLFIWSSTYFGRHTAHHQEPKSALAASGFSYVEGWWTCSWWTLSVTLFLVAGREIGGRCQAQCDWQRPPTTCPTTFHVWKTRGCQCSFRLLMMGDVSLETCWASYKYGIIKVWYIVASCWIFLYELYYDKRIDEHQI